MNRISLSFVAACAAGCSLLAAPGFAQDSQWARPDLVEDVASGKITEANVSWWGYDAEDATRFVQAALDSKARKVTLDAQQGPWIVRPLKGRSDLTLVVPPDVTLWAKRGEYHPLNASLLSFDGVHDVTLTGGGTLKMWFEDYTNRTLYAFSEWRHAIAVFSSSNVTVENLTVADSGGDGLYLGNHANRPNTDVTVRNVTFVRNNRQGISVISANRLLIDRCWLLDTCGTAPMAGIDFEPNLPSEMMRHILVRDCVARGNRGCGFDFAVFQLAAESTPVSIILENCRSENNAKPTHFCHSIDPITGFRGKVQFRNCVFEDGPQSAANFRVPDGKGTMAVTFANCRARMSDGSLGTVDGADWGWSEIPRMTWPDGSTIVQTPIDEAAFRAARVRDLRPGETVRLAAMPLRNKGSYFVYAAAPGPVRLKGVVRQVGRIPYKDCTITVFDLKGKRVASPKGPIAFNRETDLSFVAPAAGFYRIDFYVKGALTFTETDAPLAIAPFGKGRGLDFDAGGGTLYLNVTGTTPFIVTMTGGGGVELFHARIEDASGACVFDADNISTKLYTAPEKPKEGLWKFTSSRPTKGCFDDYFFMVYGRPCFLFLTPEKVW